MHSLDAIKKMNGEYPDDSFPFRAEGSGVFAPVPDGNVLPPEYIAELKEKAAKWDAHVKEMRSAPMRRNVFILNR